MQRRDFVKNTLAATATTLAAAAPVSAASTVAAKPFKTKFSPEFGIFRGLSPADPVDEVKWGYDQGFRAWENTMLRNRPVAEQERISQAMQRLGMDFGQFVGTITFKDITFAGRDASLREAVLADVRASVEVAKRMNTQYIHNVLGVSDPKLPWDFQLANAIDLLKRIAEIYEPHGLVMVMESMNHRVDHPNMFLHTIPQAYALAKAVGSPSVKVLFDFYHVQVQEGHLLATLDYAWDEIAYIQVGDSPGRKEPTSGEINFPNVIKHIYDKGYRGFVGMEHGLSQPGKAGAELALKAYRAIDVS